MKNNILATAIFSLAIAVLIGSLLISSALHKNGDQTTDETNRSKTSKEETLLTLSELEDYLGITEEEIQMLVNEDVAKSHIPYIKIGNEFYFSVQAIDNWLLEQGPLQVGQ